MTTRARVQTLHPGRDQWWAISGEALYAALLEAWEGEDPEDVYQRLYAESDHEKVPPCHVCGKPQGKTHPYGCIAGSIVGERA